MKTNNILLVNKPKGMTSRDVVNELVKKFSTKRIGHTGTLDPIAEGVLVVCINEATKLCELLTSTYKEYIAEIKLGISTDTLDTTGNILKKTDVPLLNKNEIINTLNSFLGKSVQEVPLFSAVKINGKKLYEYARNNENVVLPKRDIEIKQIELIEFNNDIIKFRVTVSKGTYIRSLIKDICAKLGTIGTMQSLVRTKQGDFSIKESFTLEQIKSNNFKLLELTDALNSYVQIELKEDEYFKIKNGAIIDKKTSDDIVVFTYKNKVVAIYKTYEKNKDKMKPYKVITNN